MELLEDEDTSDRASTRRRSGTDDKDERRQPPEPVLCAACQHPLTTTQERTEVSGRHAHTFMNPDGIVFHILVFASVPGGLALGPVTDYWSWFPGTTWQACVCFRCSEHIGWQYRGADTRFVGLIHERISD